MSRKSFVFVGLVLITALGYAVTSLGARAPKPKKVGQLRVFDANGKKVGNVVDVAVGTPDEVRVAFRHRKQSFLLDLDREGVTTVGIDVLFVTSTCTGLAHLFANQEHLLTYMTLPVALSGVNGTVWVTDPHTAPWQTFNAKSKWIGGTCASHSSSLDQGYPAEQLFNFYDEYTGPFEIR